MNDPRAIADTGLPGWAVLELMSHRKLGGYLREEEFAGQKFVCIDMPIGGGMVTTQLYSPGAVYCITPTSEAGAMSVAAM